MFFLASAGLPLPSFPLLKKQMPVILCRKPSDLERVLEAGPPQGDDCTAYGLMHYYYIILQASKVCQEG